MFVDSAPRDAAFVVRDDAGVLVLSGTTPETVVFDSDGGPFDAADYTVTFEKQGFRAHTVELEAQLDPWYWGNLVFPGTLGFLLDPLAGGMWRMRPRHFVFLPPSRADP